MPRRHCARAHGGSRAGGRPAASGEPHGALKASRRPPGSRHLVLVGPCTVCVTNGAGAATLKIARPSLPGACVREARGPEGGTGSPVLMPEPRALCTYLPGAKGLTRSPWKSHQDFPPRPTLDRTSQTGSGLAPGLDGARVLLGRGVGVCCGSTVAPRAAAPQDTRLTRSAGGSGRGGRASSAEVPWRWRTKAPPQAVTCRGRKLNLHVDTEQEGRPPMSGRTAGAPEGVPAGVQAGPLAI